MTASTPPRPLETLLAHREWVRAVARSVARDPTLADDLEQDAWLAAARTPPHPGPGLRGWFASVLRRRRHELHRGSVRREIRELAAARPESAPSALSVVAEAEAHERVVRAVLDLDEPWRETVLLRWFEGLPPREIAARHGVPVETVRTRLKRAVELLRERLVGRRKLEPGDWLLVLAAATAARSRDAAVGGGTAVAAGIATKLGLVGFAALLVILAVVATSDPVEDPVEDDPAVARATAEADRPARRERAARAAAPKSQGSGAEDAAVAAASAKPAGAGSAGRGAAGKRGRIAGRVVGTDGRPLAGVAVAVPSLRGGYGWVETDADGRFSLLDVKVGTSVPVWIVGATGYGRPGASVTVTEGGEAVLGDVTMATYPEVMVRGRAVSKSGAPLTGGTAGLGFAWDASIALNDEQAPSLGRMVWGYREDTLPPAVARWLATTPLAADGSFEMLVPALPEGVDISVRADGHMPGGKSRLSLADGEPPPLLVELAPLPKARGVVVDATDGRPVPGAKVAFAQAHTSEFYSRAVTTGDDGRFDVAVKEAWGTSTRLSVLSPNHVDFSVDVPADAGELRIEVSPVRTVRGTVTLSDGTPVKGAWIDANPKSGRRHDGTGNHMKFGGFSTDALGRLELKDLWDGPWTLTFRGGDTEGATEFTAREVDAVVSATTEDLRIVVEPSAAIRGIVVDAAGVPVAGVLVTVDEAVRGNVLGATTLSDGTFRILGVSGTRTVTAGRGAGSGFLPSRVPGVAAGTRDLRIVLSRGLAIEGVVVDEDGRPVAGRDLGIAPSDSDPFRTHTAGGAAKTGVDGGFRISGLEPERFRIAAAYNPSDARSWLAGGESVEAGTTGVRLVLTAGTTISGRLVDAAGEPLANRRVDALWTPEASGGKHVYTDADGRFTISGLPANRAYTVSSVHGRVADVAAGTRDLVLSPQRK